MDDKFNFDFSGLASSLSKIEKPVMPAIKMEVPDINGRLKEAMESINQIEVEKHRREVENNKSLKALVEYNEDISRYNKELVSLNEKILNKINSLDDTLTFLNGALSKKATQDSEYANKQLILLTELIDIIENKDSNKLETFMNNIGAPVATGLLVEYLKIKFGLG